MLFLLLLKPLVSVAGCLGYDVLEVKGIITFRAGHVSVAGCLGYDVLERQFILII